MTNEQTIDAIMKSARARITSENAIPVAVVRMPAEEVAALLDEIERLARECADLREDYANIKDAMRDDGDAYRTEIAALKQRLTDSGRDMQALKADRAPGEWIEWKGGECPIADGAWHQIKTRDGWVSDVEASAPAWNGWHHEGSDTDIVAWLVQ